jgi:hypothetical protein
MIWAFAQSRRRPSRCAFDVLVLRAIAITTRKWPVLFPEIWVPSLDLGPLSGDDSPDSLAQPLLSRGEGRCILQKIKNRPRFLCKSLGFSISLSYVSSIDIAEGFQCRSRLRKAATQLSANPGSSEVVSDDSNTPKKKPKRR